MERIRKVWPLKERFQLPKDFDTATYFKDSFGIFKEKETASVVIVFSKSVASFIQERQWHPSQKIKMLSGGRIQLSVTVTSTREIKAWIMGFCEHAWVLEPKTLHEEIKKDLEKMVRVYEK